MEFQAETTMVFKLILYIVLCENFLRGPTKVSRWETETISQFWQRDQFELQTNVTINKPNINHKSAQKTFFTVQCQTSYTF